MTRMFADRAQGEDGQWSENDRAEYLRRLRAIAIEQGNRILLQQQKLQADAAHWAGSSAASAAERLSEVDSKLDRARREHPDLNAMGEAVLRQLAAFVTQPDARGAVENALRSMGLLNTAEPEPERPAPGGVEDKARWLCMATLVTVLEQVRDDPAGVRAQGPLFVTEEGEITLDDVLGDINGCCDKLAREMLADPSNAAQKWESTGIAPETGNVKFAQMLRGPFSPSEPEASIGGLVLEAQKMRDIINFKESAFYKAAHAPSSAMSM